MPTPRQHALLSASSAHRWLACTAAPHFEENFPDGTSSYAEEGTLAHAICELYARKKFTVLSTRKFNSELKKLQARPLYSDEMLRTAEAYVEYLTEKAMQYATPPHVAMEVKVDLTAYSSGCNWAAYGLFGIPAEHDIVVVAPGDQVDVYPFADGGQEADNG